MNRQPPRGNDNPYIFSRLARDIFRPMCWVLFTIGIIGIPNFSAHGQVIINPNASVTIKPETQKDDIADIQLEWISPRAEKVQGFRILYIELKATASEKLTEENFEVMLEEVITQGGKSGETSLFEQNENEYTFSKKVILNTEKPFNVIKVRARDSKGRYSEEAIKFVEIVDKADIQIIWKTPDLADLPGGFLTHSKQTLPFIIDGRSLDLISLEDIVVYYNEKAFKPNENAFFKTQEGKFRYKDEFPIRALSGVQTLYIEVRGTPSEVLKFSYVPDTNPNLHIYSIGPKTDLKYTVKDAKDFANFFEITKTYNTQIFNSVNVYPILGETATAGEIAGTMEDFVAQYKTGKIKLNDVIVLFISSHGFIYNGEFRIQGGDYRPTRKEITSVSYKDQIVDKLEEIPCKKIVFLDACHSGGAKASLDAINEAILSLNRTGTGIVTISSSTENQASWEDDSWENGAFTEAIIKGLGYGGPDKDKNKIITVRELFQYLEKEVPKMVLNVKGENQIPQMVRDDDLSEIPIFVLP